MGQGPQTQDGLFRPTLELSVVLNGPLLLGLYLLGHRVDSGDWSLISFPCLLLTHTHTHSIHPQLTSPMRAWESWTAFPIPTSSFLLGEVIGIPLRYGNSGYVSQRGLCGVYKRLLEFIPSYVPFCDMLQLFLYLCCYLSQEDCYED